MAKTFWLLEIRAGGNSYYIAHNPNGFALTKKWDEGNRFREKKYADTHLRDLRAMYPGISLLGDVEVLEHGTL